MQDAILNELLDSKYAEARDRFAEGDRSHEDLTIIMLKHQTNHIAHLDQDVHSEINSLRAEIGEVKDSLDAEIKEVKDSLGAKIADLGKDINNQSWRMVVLMGLLTSVFTFIVKF